MEVITDSDRSGVGGPTRRGIRYTSLFSICAVAPGGIFDVISIRFYIFVPVFPVPGVAATPFRRVVRCAVTDHGPRTMMGAKGFLYGISASREPIQHGGRGVKSLVKKNEIIAIVELESLLPAMNINTFRKSYNSFIKMRLGFSKKRHGQPGEWRHAPLCIAACEAFSFLFIHALFIYFQYNHYF